MSLFAQTHPTITMRHQNNQQLHYLLPFCCGTMTVEMTSESPDCTPPKIAQVSTFLAVLARAANMNASMAW
jgi:hypothetical protein